MRTILRPVGRLLQLLLISVLTVVLASLALLLKARRIVVRSSRRAEGLLFLAWRAKPERFSRFGSGWTISRIAEAISME